MLLTEHEPQVNSTIAAADPAFRADVLRGLSAPAKTVPARWFYDLRGSELFEAITQLPEYYPTRVETALLREHSGTVAQRLGERPVVVEFGSGSSVKTRILLGSMPRAAYVPIDICGEFLAEACTALAALFPDLDIRPVTADFMEPVILPTRPGEAPMLGFFPGSTIGNLLPAAAIDLLRTMRGSLGEGAWLLIGIDRVKAVDRLLAAYDDARGVTAQFNLNLARRINRELGGTIPIDDLRHEARWNAGRSRIEMHLAAARPVRFEVCGQAFAMDRGETIHTENCHKYTADQIALLLQASGWDIAEHWTDPAKDFSLVLARALVEPCGP